MPRRSLASVGLISLVFCALRAPFLASSVSPCLCGLFCLDFALCSASPWIGATMGNPIVIYLGFCSLVVSSCKGHAFWIFFQLCASVAVPANGTWHSSSLFAILAFLPPIASGPLTPCFFVHGILPVCLSLSVGLCCFVAGVCGPAGVEQRIKHFRNVNLNLLLKRKKRKCCQLARSFDRWVPNKLGGLVSSMTHLGSPGKGLWMFTVHLGPFLPLT